MPAHRKYPLPTMQVGQVEFVPEKKALANYIRGRGLVLGMKFKTKRVGDQRQVRRVS